MSDSENIHLWKKKAEIDYIFLFVPLWLALDAWMRDRYGEDTDRKKLELLKQGGNKIYDDFTTLLFVNDDDRAKAFQRDFAKLHRALETAHIPYPHDNKKVISFSEARFVSASGKADYIKLVDKDRREEGDIELGVGIFLCNDESMVFHSFIEILYQIRCALFHGDLKPNAENERVIKQLYLLTIEIMKRV